MTQQTQAITALCQLLKTGDEVDRCYASRALGVLGDQSAIMPLIDCLRDEDIDVCVDAATALGNIGSEEAIPSLIESLANDNSGEVCTVVTESLNKIGGNTALEALMKVAIERPEGLEWDDDWDTWWDVQREAVKGLGRCGDDRAVDTLLKIIDNEEQQDIETEILTALAQIKDRGIEVLITRLQNQDDWPKTRRRAAKVLGTTDSPDATHALGRALQDKSPEVRAEAALALADQGAEQYLNAMILLTRDQDETVRKAVIKAVSIMIEASSHSEQLQKQLLPMFNDPSSEVRASLFNALTKTVVSQPLTAESLKPVLASLNDSNFNTATAACTLLGSNGNPEVVPELIRILRDRSKYSMVRREAALAIGTIGQYDTEMVDQLARAIGDKEQPVRLAALSALIAFATTGNRLKPDEDTTNPLDVVIAAVKGEIELASAEDEATEAAPEQQSAKKTPNPAEGTKPVVETIKIHVPPPPAPTNQETSIAEEPVPESIADTIVLPDSPARIVQEGEVKPAMSTLDAIAMENVEVALDLNTPEEEPELDIETQEYLKVVDENKEIMKRMRSNRTISVEEDVRRLGARILAGITEKQAIEILIQALNDDSPVLRREAAESIAETALKTPQPDKLMDAVGIMITQLSIGDVDQRLICARALGNLGNRAAIAPLIAALQDQEPSVRLEIINALARLATDGANPTEADHMVVEDIPPLEIARAIMESTSDKDIGVRITAAKGLARILSLEENETFTNEAVEKIIANIFKWSGEEARMIGSILRAFDLSMSTETLLSHMDQAPDSLKRSIAIEMLEELHKPEQPLQDP
ncbi:MAG: HEAT repeat domain-containing protein, partial [Gammaproteobacteria bacterium]|nr:HEAT repeat domain-containing protein [Gammaproteobacteria bacterium]